MNEPRTIHLLDTTLRDGEQTPGVSLTAEDKIEIARQLSLLGVDVIEAGFPSSSEGERRIVKDIVKLGLTSKICALSRCTKKDIDAALACDVDLVHVFIPTSPVQMKYAVNMTPQQVLASAVESIQYVKAHGVKCEFSPMDATRTELPFLKQICKAAQDAGMDSLNVPDTVGIMIPKSTSELIGEIKKEITVPISIHCHDAFATAVANIMPPVGSRRNSSARLTVKRLGRTSRPAKASHEKVSMALQGVNLQVTRVPKNSTYSTDPADGLSSRQGIAHLMSTSIGEREKRRLPTRIMHSSPGVTERPLNFEPISQHCGAQNTLSQFPGAKSTGTRGIKAKTDRTRNHTIRAN
jgi:2-isopropylmalate synthase